MNPNVFCYLQFTCIVDGFYNNDVSGVIDTCIKDKCQSRRTRFAKTKSFLADFERKICFSLFLIKYEGNYECAYCVIDKERLNTDTLQQQLSV